jgi:hypothetical protein
VHQVQEMLHQCIQNGAYLFFAFLLVQGLYAANSVSLCGLLFLLIYVSHQPHPAVFANAWAVQLSPSASEDDARAIAQSAGFVVVGKVRLCTNESVLFCTSNRLTSARRGPSMVCISSSWTALKIVGDHVPMRTSPASTTRTICRSIHTCAASNNRLALPPLFLPPHSPPLPL